MKLQAFKRSCISLQHKLYFKGRNELHSNNYSMHITEHNNKHLHRAQVYRTQQTLTGGEIFFLTNKG